MQLRQYARDIMYEKSTFVGVAWVKVSSGGLCISEFAAGY